MDFYAELLTDKQREALELYYNDDADFFFKYNYAPDGSGRMITSRYENLAIDDYKLTNRLTTKMIVKIESGGEIVDAWTSRPEPISIKEACIEAGITYERYLECKEIAQSYGYE